jgi:TetR/AcrR family transcriptional repressor of nem operon
LGLDRIKRPVYFLIERELIMESVKTKQVILEKGARLIHERGYHSTGITEILKAAGVPKGSFYYYFPSKEAFGLEVIDYYRSHFSSLAGQHLTQNDRPAIDRLKAMFERFEQFYVSEGARLGCPVGNLASELGDVNESFRAKLAEVVDEMCGAVEAFLKAAAEGGELRGDIDRPKTAEFIIQGWEGALVLMKVAGNIDPLVTFREQTFKYLDSLRI